MAIANALGIHDANLYVPSQCQMLKTIVAHNDLGLWKLMQEMPSRLKPVAANHHRNGAFSVDEKWLIASLCRGTVVGNDVKFRCLAAIPSAHNTYLVTLMSKALHNGDREWRFSTATRNHIANHNDRGLDPLTLQKT
jgi:hypothetical protein